MWNSDNTEEAELHEFPRFDSGIVKLVEERILAREGVGKDAEESVKQKKIEEYLAKQKKKVEEKILAREGVGNNVEERVKQQVIDEYMATQVKMEERVRANGRRFGNKDFEDGGLRCSEVKDKFDACLKLEDPHVAPGSVPSACHQLMLNLSDCITSLFDRTNPDTII